MKVHSSSTSPNRLAKLLGWALIALMLHATLAAIVLLAGYILLQRGVTPNLPWLFAVQKHLYMKGFRNIWQAQPGCITFDEELIYKPKEGPCIFNNAEFSTTLNFAADGRFTGVKPSGTGVAVLGDSHAMGWGVQDEETFSAELQRLSRRPVYNLAVSSYGTVRELYRLEKSELLDKVDTVVIQYCENDIEENRRNRIAEVEENRNQFEKIAGHKENRNGLVKMLWKAYGYSFSTPFRSLRPSRAAKSPEDFSPHHAPLVAVLEKHASLRGKRILVFYINAYGRPFKSFPVGKDRQLPNIEFIETGLESGDFYRIDDHLTPAGHRKLAGRVHEAIKRTAPR
jgi:lysophospholipase L1-like esterase